MANAPQTRRAIRLSRPNQEKFFTVMVVFSHRTFRWSLPRKMLFKLLGLGVGIWLLAMVGSAYGFWATKKIMSFPTLQQETKVQSAQINQSLGQAQVLENEVANLRNELANLLQTLNPKDAPQEPVLLNKRGKRGKKGQKEAAPVPESKEASPSATTNTGGSANAGNAAQLPGPYHERLANLKAEIERTSNQAKAIRAKIEPVIDRWNHTPSIAPTAGYISSQYGLRLSPFAKVNNENEGFWAPHTGIDISNAIGTPIQATAYGKVAFAGWMGNYGWCVMIRHTEELESLYGHLSRIDVEVGEKVGRGDIIGRMGRSGRSTGPHLHYEVRRFGHPVNPNPYLRLQKQWVRSLR